MQTTLTIFRYKNWGIPFAFLSMAVFRFPLFFNKKISFYKLMGSGKNGTFDKEPDLNQWAIFAVHESVIEIQNENSILKNLYTKIGNSYIYNYTPRVGKTRK